MKFEYLLFNLIVFVGPLIMSFDKNLRFIKKWKYAFPAILTSLVPFVIWDWAVTNHHWWFNESYIISIHIGKLPLEEILFFITVPFACIFLWNVQEYYHIKLERSIIFPYGFLFIIFIPIGITFLVLSKIYTALIFFSFAIVIVSDKILKTKVLENPKTLYYLIGLFFLTFIFNSYLTARPIVLYDPAFQLDFRILTIPVEDFGFGISHIFLTLIFYEKYEKLYGKKC